MAKDGTWVDHMFIQITAWYMGLDILILTTSSQPKYPFIHISGHIANCGELKSGPPILIGNYTNVHYQSLLNHDKDKNKGNHHEKKEGVIAENKQTQDFTFYQNEKRKTFQILKNGKIKCPGDLYFHH